MAGFEDTIRKAVPGGDIAKPLMLALLALLASGVLFGNAMLGPLPALMRNRPPIRAPVVCSEVWAACWKSCRRKGWATRSTPGLAAAKISRSRLASWAPRSAPTLSRRAQRSGMSEEEITRQLSQILPGVVDKLTPQGRLPTAAELSQTT